MTSLQMHNLLSIVGNLTLMAYAIRGRNWLAALGWFMAFYFSVALYGYQQ